MGLASASEKPPVQEAAPRSRLLIEERFPIREVSIENQRERGQPQALPPNYFLHVWWARRPLTVSRAAVLGALVGPECSDADFLEWMGIPRGTNLVREHERILEAKARKEKLKTGYSEKRAFSTPLSKATWAKLGAASELLWGKKPVVLDCFAGGGAIPLEASRVGADVISMDLNPVATVIQKATVDYPAAFGPGLVRDIERVGKEIIERIAKELDACFPKAAGEDIFGYVWVRTTACPSCLLSVPLTPNFWLDVSTGLSYAPRFAKEGRGSCEYQLTKGLDHGPASGTMKGGSAECPRCKTILDSEYLRKEAAAGRSGLELVAIGIETARSDGKTFRLPTEADATGLALADKRLGEKRVSWQRDGILPTEPIPPGLKTDEPISWGNRFWTDMFSKRQLLVHGTYVETLRTYNWESITDAHRREAVRTYLAIVLDKCVDWNSLGCRMISGKRILIRGSFQMHAFPYIFSPAEMDGAGKLQQWCLGQVIKSYKGLCALPKNPDRGSIRVLNGNAAVLPLAAGSVDAVCIDPPYSDNVMYAECSDFFYVWLKRSLGDVFPDLFQSELTDKDAEAVANKSRFRESKGRTAKLAEDDYNAKMQAVFRESHRVLRPDGVMVVMFTHKKLEAWDSLAMALLNAGFEITATWPVHTEPENSRHQAKLNAASSTILLVCRKRVGTADAWWEDVKGKLDETVKLRAAEFEKVGIPNQDLFIMCFGPALQVISERWPVKNVDNTVIRPEQALQRAREVLKDHRFSRIAGGAAKGLDASTQFYILAWDTFRAREFPYDEARRLALAAGINEKDLMASGILVKKSSNVVLATPAQRAKAGKLKADAKSYDLAIDYVHAALLAYQHGQSAELKLFHERTKGLQIEKYRKCLQVLSEPGILPQSDEVEEYQTLVDMLQANPALGITINTVTTKTGAKQQQKGIDSY